MDNNLSLLKSFTTDRVKSIYATEKDKHCISLYVESKKYNRLVNTMIEKQTHVYGEQISSY